MMNIPKTYLYVGGAIAALLILNALTRGKNGSILGSTGEAITGGVVGSVADFVTGSVTGVVKQVSPTNQNNVINQAFNKITGAVLDAENDSFSFGAWLYDKTHDDVKFK